MTKSNELPSQDAVLDFWFGKIEDGDVTDHSKRKRWFNSTPEFDETIRSNFLHLYEQSLSGALPSWQDTASGSLALVVVLDQFPLNMFRRSARAFESEHAAVAACQHALLHAQDTELSVVERTFLYMPLMHAESAELQAESVRRYTDLAAQAPPHLKEMAEHTAKFARNHRDIVSRFGRFPHRNPVLGRTNTPAESEYLAEGPSSYGQ